MTGIDTNILVRFFAQDDLDQSHRVDEVLQLFTSRDPGFVTSVAVVELAWVLRRQYGVSKAQFIGYVEQLIDSPEIVLEHESALKQALIGCSRGKADFADCLIERVCAEAGCTRTVTFDAGAAKASLMSLL